MRTTANEVKANKEDYLMELFRIRDIRETKASRFKSAFFICAMVGTQISLSQFLWGVGADGFTDEILATKALGMGNAFTAVANDPTAVFLTPQASPKLNLPAFPLE